MSADQRQDYNKQDFNKVDVLIVGAGPAGLAAAISAKCWRPELDVCVIDKAPAPGNHVLSGAVLEPGVLAPGCWTRSDLPGEQAKRLRRC